MGGQVRRLGETVRGSVSKEQEFRSGCVIKEWEGFVLCLVTKDLVGNICS